MKIIVTAEAELKLRVGDDGEIEPTDEQLEDAASDIRSAVGAAFSDYAEYVDTGHIHLRLVRE